MTGTMFFNMLLNIGLLVLLATLLTNMASVRKLFRGESSTIIQKMALAVIFGAISIVSTYTGDKDRRGHRQYPRHRRSDSRDHGRTACRNDDGTHRRSPPVSV